MSAGMVGAPNRAFDGQPMFSSEPVVQETMFEGEPHGYTGPIDPYPESDLPALPPFDTEAGIRKEMPE